MTASFEMDPLFTSSKGKSIKFLSLVALPVILALTSCADSNNSQVAHEPAIIDGEIYTNGKTAGDSVHQSGLIVTEPVESLWHYLSDYAKGSTFEKKHFKQPIPSAVITKMESVVCVHIKAGSQDFNLSGFIVDKNGLIICTAHDLKETQEISVTLYNGRKIKGQVVKIDHHRDLTLVDVGIKLDKPIRLDKGRNLMGMGELLFSVACPINFGGMVHSGIINSPPRRVKDLMLWQVNMTIHLGSSGSPVFDINGNLVAIVKGRYRGTDSVGFLIPFETLLAFLKEA